MTVLVTGANGFIGRHVCALLERRGHAVVRAVRHTTDLNDGQAVRALLDETQPEAVIHLAWHGLPDYSAALCEQNRRMSQALVTAVFERPGCTLLATGSCWEYASRQGTLNEESPTADDAPFTNAKLRVLEHGQRTAASTGNTFFWVRPFFVYGPGQRTGALLPHIVSELARDRVPELRTPDARNDFIHVRDVASAICTLAESDLPGGIYNIGSGTATSIREVTHLACQALDRQSPEGFDEIRAPQGENFNACMKKLHNDTGWSPAVKLTEGIRDTVHSLLKEAS